MKIPKWAKGLFAAGAIGASSGEAMAEKPDRHLTPEGAKVEQVDTSENIERSLSPQEQAEAESSAHREMNNLEQSSQEKSQKKADKIKAKIKAEDDLTEESKLLKYMSENAKDGGIFDEEQVIDTDIEAGLAQTDSKLNQGE